jgi:hypothetical protein
VVAKPAVNPAESSPPPRDAEDWWVPDSGCLVATLCIIVVLILILLAWDWLV